MFLASMDHSLLERVKTFCVERATLTPSPSNVSPRLRVDEGGGGGRGGSGGPARGRSYVGSGEARVDSGEAWTIVGEAWVVAGGQGCR